MLLELPFHLIIRFLSLSFLFFAREREEGRLQYPIFLSCCEMVLIITTISLCTLSFKLQCQIASSAYDTSHICFCFPAFCLVLPAGYYLRSNCLMLNDLTRTKTTYTVLREFIFLFQPLRTSVSARGVIRKSGKIKRD